MTPRRATLSALRSGSAVAVLALAVLAGPARASGFNATIASSTGVSATTSDITVFGTEGTIDWNALATTATDTNVDFLPQGETVSFHDAVGSSSGDFTVLNRVFPSFNGQPIPATISFSGNVTSNVSGSAGGTLWFYSPYGIIANGTSSFNVGSLLLTTSDIAVGPQGELYPNQPNQVGLLQASQSGSFVRILPGATINASNGTVNSAYVGVFAPRIEQGGAIRSDGNSALVAGEAGTLTFNAGLVDIAVSVGTSDPNGIVHTGSTGGQASLDGEPHTVAFVAVPKNTALQMLLSGTIGNDAAAAGIGENSAVVLYAGSTTKADATRPDYDSPPATAHATVSTPAADTTGNIAIGNTTFNAPLRALATGAITVDPVYSGAANPGLVDFRQTAELYAGTSIGLTAGAGETIRAGDSLFLAPMFRQTGEDVSVTVSGDPTGTIATPGQIAVTNLLEISADGAPDFNAAPATGTGAAGKGGDIAISVSQGTLSAGLDLSVHSIGIGQDSDTAGGTGTGSGIDIGVSNKGTITAANLAVSAIGSGGNSLPDAFGSTSGGDAFGGTVTLHDDGGTIDVAGVSLLASASGGVGQTASGSATGGQATVRIGGAAQSWDSLFVDASAQAGGALSTTTAAGSATGQANGVLLAISGSGALTTNRITLDNSAYVNPGSTAAHAASAGGIDVQVSAGGSLTVAEALEARADAALPAESFVGNVVVAPTMSAGRVTVVADNAIVDLGAADLHANAVAVGAGTTGALATGGTVDLTSANGATITLGTFQPNRISAEAYGAVGPAASDALGGFARVTADGGTITSTADLAVSGSALWGGVDYLGQTSGQGFNATGRIASVDVLPGSGSITVGNLSVYAKGEASLALIRDGAGDLGGLTSNTITGIGGNGGTGTGGTARVNLFGGSLDATNLRVEAYGVGGASGLGTTSGFQSGTGQGGTALLTQTGGTLTTGAVSLGAYGLGGTIDLTAISGAIPANGGNAAGGTARASLAGGTATLGGDFLIDATAKGGAGMASGLPTSGGNGGNANNGAAVAELLMPLGSTASLTAPNLLVSANATGGAGGASAGGTAGTGGSATAGTARINLADGAIAVPGDVAVLADATGGGGSTGGNATGGTSAFFLTDTLAAPATTRTLGSLTLSGSALGGTGATAGTDTAGTTKFTAQAGRTASALAIGGDFLARATGGIAPAGDGFTGNFGTVPVSVNGAVTITTPRDINATTLAGGGLTATQTLDLSGRSINVAGPGVLAAGGNVTVLATNSIALGGLSSGGTTLLRAQDPTSLLYGPVSVQNLASAGLVTAETGSFLAGGTGNLAFADSFSTVGQFSVQTSGNLAFANVSSAGALNATAGGAVTATGSLVAAGNTAIDGATGITLPTLTSGGTTSLRSANGTITVGTLTSAGPLSLFGRTATISATGPLAVSSATTTAGDLSLTAPGTITVATADVNGAVTLTSATGDVSATALSATGLVTANGRAVTIGSPGSLTFANSAASAGAFSATAAGNLTFANVSATGPLAVTAGGLAQFNGLARAPTIAVTSGDIRIGATGRIGQRGLTTAITLTNSAPGAGTAIGGAGATSGWSLDAAEALRLFADQSIAISVPANASSPAPVTVGSLGIAFGAGATANGPGANIGAGGSFSVTTPGIIRVNGAVAPAMAGNGDLVALTAGQRIDVVTDTGSIVLKNANGALAGTLRMSAPTVRVATASALAALDTPLSLPAATARLASNDGLVNTAGAIQANALEFNVASSTLYIQNSGIDSQFANRRGFAANAMAINGLAGAQPSFAVNGVIFANGQPITGLSTYASILVNGTAAALGGAFNPLSTVNGCAAGLDCSVPPGVIAPPHGIIDDLAAVLTAGSGNDSRLNLPVVQFGETPLLNSPPLIDEPVTGVGNDDLWSKRCGADKNCTD